MSNKWWSNQTVKNGWNCTRATGFGLVIHWVKNGGSFPSQSRLELADVARRQTKMAGIGHVLLGLVWLAGSVGSLEDSFPRTPIINTRHHTPDISRTCDDLCFFSRLSFYMSSLFLIPEHLSYLPKVQISCFTPSKGLVRPCKNENVNKLWIHCASKIYIDLYGLGENCME